MTSGEKLEAVRKDFDKYSKEIAESLMIPFPKTITKIEIQDIDSHIETPAIGEKYGVHYEDDTLILAHWIFDLRIKEQEAIVEYVLVREIFRQYFIDSSIDQQKLEFLIELAIHVLAGGWISQTGREETYTDKKIRYIDQRSAFEDRDNIQAIDWIIAFFSVIRHKLPINEVFQKIFTTFQDATKNNWSLIEIDGRTRYSIKKLVPQDPKFGLPRYLDDRNYAIFELLISDGYQNSSTKQIAEKLNLSHDVIYRAFKMLFDDYTIYWYPRYNYPLLKLYPHYLRLTLTNSEYKKLIIEKFMTIKYITDIHESIDGQEPIITVRFACPLILHNQLTEYFLKLQKNGIIKDFFFQQIRRRILQCAITRDDLEPTEETFQQLFENPYSIDFKSFTLLDEKFDFSNLPKYKKAVFDPNVLNFISIYTGTHLVKIDYMFNYLPAVFEFCEKNNIDPKDSKAINYFINQLEIRCRKLGILDYSLFVYYVVNYSGVIIFEILENFENEKMKQLLEKLKISYGIAIFELSNRTLLAFPRIKLDHLFIQQIVKQIQKLGINFLYYQNKIYKDSSLVGYLHELYDYKNKKWTY